MAPTNELRFAVSDRIDDTEVGPGHVPLSLLSEFPRDVTDFLRGSKRELDPQQVIISIESGSLALVASGLAAATALWSDLANLQFPDSLHTVDPKRAAVMERWQAAARQNPRRKYLIADSAQRIGVSVDASTDFRRAEEVWVPVEKYIDGKVLDWGGKTKPNVHLEMPNGTVLKVSAPQVLLEQEPQNRLYRHALLHIRAEENLRTGVLRNPVLLAFGSDQNTFDETEFQRMVKLGTEAWKDVPDATAWVEDLRGGKA